MSEVRQKHYVEVPREVAHSARPLQRFQPDVGQVTRCTSFPTVTARSLYSNDTRSKQVKGLLDNESLDLKSGSVGQTDFEAGWRRLLPDDQARARNHGSDHCSMKGAFRARWHRRLDTYHPGQPPSVLTRALRARILAATRSSGNIPIRPAASAVTLSLPNTAKQLSNCHRHALHEWLLALKRANVANLPIGGTIP